MQSSITYEGDWSFHGIMSDLGVDFTQTPFHRIGFTVEEAALDALSAHYADAVFAPESGRIRASSVGRIF